MKRILLLIVLVTAIGCEVELVPQQNDSVGQNAVNDSTDYAPNMGTTVGRTDDVIFEPTQSTDMGTTVEDPQSDPIDDVYIYQLSNELPTKVHGKKIKETWSGKVVKITDGDTITVLKDDEQIKVRLESIDTPERKQPFGTVAKDALAAMVHEKPVTIYETGKDRYGRSLGFVVVGDLDVCHEMVWQGFAWNYTQYSKSEQMAASEKEARAAGRGLWAGQGPDDQVPPWEWRRR